MRVHHAALVAHETDIGTRHLQGRAAPNLAHGFVDELHTRGLLSETGMPGMQLIHEAVRQIRGSANQQVPGADVCVVSNQGGVMHTHATLIVGSP